MGRSSSLLKSVVLFASSSMGAGTGAQEIVINEEAPLMASAPVDAGTRAGIEIDPCGFEFQRGFAYPGGFDIGIFNQGLPRILDLAPFDGPEGPQLALAGSFLTMGGTSGSSVTLWDGVEYLATARAGPSPRVTSTSVASFDDGSGEALYAVGLIVPADAGFFGFARWDGDAWSDDFATGGPYDADGVFVFGDDAVLRVDDLGAGDVLLVGGESATTEASVASFGPAGWEVLGDRSALRGRFQDLIVFDDGNGPALFVAGRLQHQAPGGAMGDEKVVVRRDGVWEGISDGLPPLSNEAATALEVFDAGDGPQLFLAMGFAGVFRLVDGTWEPVDEIGENTFQAFDLATWDDGTGSSLFIAGLMLSPDRQKSEDVDRAGPLARWRPGEFFLADGNAITSRGLDPIGPGFTLEVFDDGRGEAMFVGGSFTQVGANGFDSGFFAPARHRGGLTARSIARWDGEAWSPLGGGLTTPVANGVIVNISGINEMVVHDDGTGRTLYLGGDVTIQGGGVSDGVIRRRDGAWVRVGESLDGNVTALVSDEAHTGMLYAGADLQFEPFGVSREKRVLAWDGSSWSTVGETFETEGGAPPLFIGALMVDQGDGASVIPPGDVVVGGGFQFVGANPASNLAIWDGVQWTEFAGGADGPVNVLKIDPEGVASAPGALLAAGEFTMVGGMPADRIAAWDGTSWSPIGGELPEPSQGGFAPRGVLAIATFDAGDGPMLYIGGNFDFGPDAAPGFTRLEGDRWMPLPIPEDGDLRFVLQRQQFVSSFTPFDTPGGTTLALGAASSAVRGGASLIQWDGTTWGAFGYTRPLMHQNLTCSFCTVPALAQFNEGDGDALWVGGFFLAADERAPEEIEPHPFARRGASGITKWIKRGLPVIERQPGDVLVQPGGTATFSVEASPAQDGDEITYQWQRDGVALSHRDRPIVQGADSPVLWIFPVRPRDEGEYRCIVSSACGENPSHAARLTVATPGRCAGDADRSGVVDFADISMILQRWGAGSDGEVFAMLGDGQGDGVVNFRDIVSVLQHWGRRCE